MDRNLFCYVLTRPAIETETTKYTKLRSNKSKYVIIMQLITINVTNWSIIQLSARALSTHSSATLHLYNFGKNMPVFALSKYATNNSQKGPKFNTPRSKKNHLFVKFKTLLCIRHFGERVRHIFSIIYHNKKVRTHFCTKLSPHLSDFFCENIFVKVPGFMVP